MKAKCLYSFLLVLSLAAQAVKEPVVSYKFDERAKMTSNRESRKAIDVKAPGFSIAYWVKPLDCMKNPCSSPWEKVTSRVLVSNGSGYYDGFRSGMVYSDGKYTPFFAVGSAKGSRRMTSAVHVPCDEWACVVFTWDGSVAKCYVNGEMAGSSRIEREWTPAKAPLVFGAAGHGLPPLPMHLRSFDFYDCILSDSEVDDLTIDYYPVRKAARLTEKGEWAKARELYASLNDGISEDTPYSKIEPRNVPAIPATKNFLFVAPGGDDSAAGTKSAPLGTWNGAV